MAIPGDLVVFFIPALILSIILYHVGRILYRKMKAGYEEGASEPEEMEG